MKIALVFAMVPAVLRADALTDLRATLGQMTATTGVHGSFEVTSTENNSEEEKPSEGKVTVGFEADGSGLRVVYPKAMLSQAAQEARAEATDPEHQTPVRSGATRVRALHLADLLDAATSLNTALINAQLTEAKAATLQGKPVRLLVLKMNPKLSKASSKHVKKIEGTMSVWIGNDGVPLAAEQTVYVKASFMLMSFEQNQKESWTFTRTGDRLVATRYEETQKGDGMGQHSTSRVEQTVRLEP